MKGILAALLALTAIMLPVRAHAETNVLASYSAGFNMVGGPTGTDFSAASIFYTYVNGQYYTPTTKIATGCVGYWAFFVNPTTISLPVTATTSQYCHLVAGWNLLGNPLSGQADLPPGTIAYHWNPGQSQYEVVSSIPAGASVWIYSPDERDILLSFHPVQTRTPITVTLDFIPTSPVQIHVGDSIKLQLPAITPHFVTSTDQLHFTSAGYSGSLSCLGDPSCALTFESQFFILQANQPGTAFVTVTPTCVNNTPPCSIPSQRFEVDILP